MKLSTTLSILALALCLNSPAFAKKSMSKDTKGAANMAEMKMMAACNKEFPSDVKGKTAKEVSEWVETEEHGEKADAFKKSKCFAKHEAWEKSTNHEEKDEKHAEK